MVLKRIIAWNFTKLHKEVNIGFYFLFFLNDAYNWNALDFKRQVLVIYMTYN